MGPFEDCDSPLNFAGEIKCRFPNNYKEIREMGEYLKDKTTERFEPYFRIYEQGSHSEAQRIPVKVDVIMKMITTASFSVGEVRIPDTGEATIIAISLSLIDGEELPISGFPRALFAKKTKTGSLNTFLAGLKCTDCSGIQGCHRLILHPLESLVIERPTLIVQETAYMLQAMLQETPQSFDAFQSKV